MGEGKFNEIEEEEEDEDEEDENEKRSLFGFLGGGGGVVHGSWCSTILFLLYVNLCIPRACQPLDRSCQALRDSVT